MAKQAVDPRRSQRALGSALPVQLTHFIGRKQELERVKQMLKSARLLTLTGSGGCGKTRLALRALEDLSLSQAYPDGLAWVDLASLNDGSLLPQAVSIALGLHEKTEEPLTQTIARHLAAKQALLALDNCEHLVAACASLVDLVLRTCPDVQILTTSREPLGVPGEVSWLVPSLSVPDANLERPNLDEVAASDAVQLFTDRAAAVSPGFSLNDENAGIILQICRRLEGIPLAIELAAAHVRMLTVEQIAARLDNAFPLLTQADRTATIPRHKTLRAAIGWSYDLLGEQEKELFRRLPVFVGGFSLEAVEAIFDAPQTAGLRAAPASDLAAKPSIFDLLSGLVNKSLAIAITPEHGAARYYLLETIRQFAMEKLDAAGETQEYRLRHAAWFLRFSEQAETRWRGPHQAEWLERAEQEHDNLRASLRWCQEIGALEDELRIASALLHFWLVRGYLREGREVLDRALSQEAPISDAVRAKACHAAGTLAARQADYPAAWVYLEQALSLRRKTGDKHGVSITLDNLASVAINQSDYAAARKLLEESVVIKRELADKVGLAYSLSNLGEVARQEGDLSTAARLYEESLSLLRELDDKDSVAIVLVSLGNLHLAQGEYPRAAGRFSESLPLAVQLGNKWTIAMCVAGLAVIARVGGDLKRAARLHGAAQALVDQIGVPLEPADRSQFDRNIAETKAQTPAGLFSVAWGEGRRMDVAQIQKEVTDTRRPAAPQAGGEKLVITAFGPGRALRGAHELAASDWKGSKAKELLFLLLSQPSLKKEQIGLALWPDASPAQLRDNLGVTLHNLRQALGRADWIVFEDNAYKFNRALNYTFDAENFERLLNLSKRYETAAGAISPLRQAIALYGGDFLEGFGEGQWLVARREELHQKYLDALLALGQCYFDQTLYPQAADTYRQAIAADSYSERAHRGLMRCYARQGERGQAIRQYQALCEVLNGELNAKPAPETQELYQRLRSGAEI